MRRRALLASIPALTVLTGCNSHTADSTSTDSETPDATTTGTTHTTALETTSAKTTTETATTETTTTVARDPEYPRSVELASIDGTEYPGLAFDVLVHNARIDAEQTASFTATLENTGDSTLELKMGYRPPFSKVRCEDGGYLLVKPSYDGDFDPCWEPSGPRGQPALLSMMELDPGEVLTASMNLLGGPRTDACLPTGEFRFVSDFDVTRDGETESRANAITIRVAKE